MIAEPVKRTAEIELARHRFTVAEYMRMAEVELLGEDSRVELLWGEIVEMSPINVAHVLCVNRLNTLLSAKLTNRAIVSVQNPIQLNEYSLPQPDVALWALPSGEGHGQLAGPDDVLLAIEVADTSIRHDQQVKGKLYSEAGIADYWIVNLPKRRIEVYREPRPDGYRTVTSYAPGETLSPLAFADVVLSVGDVLGAKA